MVEIRKGHTIGHRIRNGDGEMREFLLPCADELNLDKPMKSILPDIDIDAINRHEQLYRAVEMFLIEEGFDAIFHGTAGEESEHMRPAIVVMQGCEKYSITFFGHDIVVVKQSNTNFGWSSNTSNRLFGVPLQDPNSMEHLADFLRTL